LKLAIGVDKEGGDRASGVFLHGGEEGGEVGGSEDGVVIHDKEVGE